MKNNVVGDTNHRVKGKLLNTYGVLWRTHNTTGCTSFTRGYQLLSTYGAFGSVRTKKAESFSMNKVHFVSYFELKKNNYLVIGNKSQEEES